MLKKYHFIAIGGIGMSGLAKYLLEDGHSVSGSDIVDSKYIDAIKKMGANVNIGHAESNLPNDTDTVVVSTAIRDTNPELQKAKKLCKQIFHRSDLLAEVAKQIIPTLKPGNVVVGLGAGTITALGKFIKEQTQMHVK